MKKIVASILSILFAASAFAQTQAEISAAKAMARSYGYTEEEINDALNGNASASSQMHFR